MPKGSPGVNILGAMLIGGLAGAVHVISGPDHLAAVAPLAVNQKRRPWIAGLYWGVGHSTGVWALALLAILFRAWLPVDAVSSWSERLVGVVLIAIGLWSLRAGLRRQMSSFDHEHDGYRHTHVDLPGSPVAPHVRESGHRHGHPALGVGALHGLAGTSHLIGVLPALVLPSAAAATTYVIGFGLGSVVAMTAFAWVVGLMRTRLERIGMRAARGLLFMSCFAAIGIGVWWLVAAGGPASVH